MKRLLVMPALLVGLAGCQQDPAEQTRSDLKAIAERTQAQRDASHQRALEKARAAQDVTVSDIDPMPKAPKGN